VEHGRRRHLLHLSRNFLESLTGKRAQAKAFLSSCVLIRFGNSTFTSSYVAVRPPTEYYITAYATGKWKNTVRGALSLRRNNTRQASRGRTLPPLPTSRPAPISRAMADPVSPLPLAARCRRASTGVRAPGRPSPGAGREGQPPQAHG
jgi:hypothetical protein